MKIKFYCIKEKLHSLITMVILFLSTQSFALSTVDHAILSGRIKDKQTGNYLIPVNIHLKGTTDILVKGQVTDVNGEAIPGVSVKVKGSTVGTTTDLDGRFTVNVADNNSILVFTYIGFLTQEIALTNRLSINIKLEKSNKVLGEIVVIGYGTQKKVNLTGSISVLDAKTIQNRPLTSSSQALQGVQGIYVNQAGGQPGRDGATIRIRGIGSIGGSGKLEPLVMVDGVEYSLNDVNPSDIESISVLKDAASTSIYGSRAANGVILITTKMGKSGSDFN
jgi:TonB-dependent starch-binding outer membrane protein SusC